MFSRKVYIIFISLFVYSCGSDFPSPPRLISVIGEANIKVQPNQVTINLSIQSENEELSIAKEENDEKTKAVKNLVKKLKINPKSIFIKQIRVNPKYSEAYFSEKKSKFVEAKVIAYKINRDITVTIKKLEKYEDFMSGIFNLGIQQIYGVDFTHSNIEKFKAQARVLAIKAAKKKAFHLAKELDEEVGDVYSVKEENLPPWVENTGELYPKKTPAGAKMFLSPSELTVGAKITVSFEFD